MRGRGVPQFVDIRGGENRHGKGLEKRVNAQREDEESKMDDGVLGRHLDKTVSDQRAEGVKRAVRGGDHRVGDEPRGRSLRDGGTRHWAPASTIHGPNSI